MHGVTQIAGNQDGHYESVVARFMEIFEVKCIIPHLIEICTLYF